MWIGDSSTSFVLTCFDHFLTEISCKDNFAIGIDWMLLCHPLPICRPCLQMRIYLPETQPLCVWSGQQVVGCLKLPLAEPEASLRVFEQYVHKKPFHPIGTVTLAKWYPNSQIGMADRFPSVVGGCIWLRCWHIYIYICMTVYAYIIYT